MDFSGVKNLIAKILVLSLMIYFCGEAESITSAAQDDQDDDNAKQYTSTLQNNYETGFYQMVQFFNTMSKKFTEFDQRLNELKNEIATVSDRVAPLTILPEKVFKHSTDCGGILQVARGLPSTIRYPNEGDYYRNWERCAWIIEPKEKFTSYYIKVESVWMQAGYDGVRVYFWDSESPGLQSQKITEFGSWIPIPAPYLLITFCSDGSRVGGGSSASIFGVGTSLDFTTYKLFWLTNPTQTFLYTSSGTNEFVAVAVSPRSSQNVTVRAVLLHTKNASIQFYVLWCHPNLDPSYHLKESVPGDPFLEGIKSTNLPFLIIFKSKEGKSSVRFAISIIQ